MLYYIIHVMKPKISLKNHIILLALQRLDCKKKSYAELMTSEIIIKKNISCYIPGVEVY